MTKITWTIIAVLMTAVITIKYDNFPIGVVVMFQGVMIDTLRNLSHFQKIDNSDNKTQKSLQNLNSFWENFY